MCAMEPLAYQQIATFFQHLHTALAKGQQPRTQAKFVAPFAHVEMHGMAQIFRK